MYFQKTLNGGWALNEKVVLIDNLEPGLYLVEGQYHGGNVNNNYQFHTDDDQGLLGAPTTLQPREGYGDYRFLAAVGARGDRAIYFINDGVDPTGSVYFVGAYRKIG